MNDAGTVDTVCPPGSAAEVLDLTAVSVEAVPGVPPDDGFATTGIEILEGPVWINQELYLSHFEGGPSPGGRLLRFRPGEASTVVLVDAAVNGLAFSGGVLFAGRHGDGSVSRYDVDDLASAPVPVVSDYEGVRFNSPNDLVVASNGDIYFTDPNWQAPIPNPQSEERVYRVSAGVVSVVASEAVKPNGITLSTTERELYVGGTNGLFRYPVDASGNVGPSVRVDGIDVAVDGLGRDCAGNLYVTTEGGVVVLDPTMARIGSIPVQAPTNVAFGGADGRTIYITTISFDGSAQLYQAQLNVVGYPY